MGKASSYPKNWAEIATAVKRDAGYQCERCDLMCLPPGTGYRHLNLSLRRKLTAQTHHRDWNPSNNEIENLVCLCAGCHLGVHRQPMPDPQQLSLDLKLPSVKKSRLRVANLQLSLTDPIVYLLRQHQISDKRYHQLSLDLERTESSKPAQILVSAPQKAHLAVLSGVLSA